ncbi:hypothetical protein KI743_14850 [Vibrio sp. D420a]|uniref:hypothetical protein n=1 Tax=Vibrio sp. D420a TaxID=2836895 RepID=UPI00255710D2|nr:hypothetical protein [Vibrio sp. D420a]MDK9763281.1 hypothetical protein [Vibrio sp. D420a]
MINLINTKTNQNLKIFEAKALTDLGAMAKGMTESGFQDSVAQGMKYFVSTVGGTLQEGLLIASVSKVCNKELIEYMTSNGDGWERYEVNNIVHFPS